MSRYFLHTGLHKTGTKFFQHKVFPNLSQDQFIYNPTKLCQYICDLMKVEDEDLHLVYKAITEEKNKLENESNKKILISREIMSGDLFSFYDGYQERYSRLHSAFPDATVICSLRYQVDWVLSCYRETVHEHHYQTIEQFLSLADGDDNFVKANYKNLDWSGIVELLNSKFGEERVNYFFYEDFKKDKIAMVKSMSKILGVESIPITKDSDTIPNRGYSAFAIKLSILRYKLFKLLWIEHKLAHRPICFFGKDGIPAGFENLSVLPHEKYWHDGFLRDNEEVRSKNYPNNLTLGEKLKLRFSWRNIIKKGLDKLFYWDWDLLELHRNELDDYFKKKNQVLKEKFSYKLGALPPKYTE